MNTRNLVQIYSILLVTTVGCGSDQREQAVVVPSLKVFVVGKQASGQTRRISGRVQAVTSSELSFGVGGRVIERIAELGKRVLKGEVLAKLDPVPLQLLVEKARSNITGARAVVTEAETARKRVTSLQAAQGASQSQVDDAETRLAAANADLGAAKQALEQAEIDLTRTALKAPFDGQIVQTPTDNYQEVAPSTVIAVIQSDGAMEVRVRVPETMIAQVDYNQPVQVTLPSDEGSNLAGIVTQIGAESEAGSGFPVTVRMSKADAGLRAGMTASVTFNFAKYLDGKSAFLVPTSVFAPDAAFRSNYGKEPAAKEAAGKGMVFVLDASSSTVRLQSVVTGSLRDNFVEVFEGLSEGDRVVCAGVAFVRDGMKAHAWSGKQGSLR